MSSNPFHEDILKLSHCVRFAAAEQSLKTESSPGLTRCCRVVVLNFGYLLPPYYRRDRRRRPVNWRFTMTLAAD